MEHLRISLFMNKVKVLFIQELLNISQFDVCLSYIYILLCKWEKFWLYNKLYEWDFFLLYDAVVVLATDCNVVVLATDYNTAVVLAPDYNAIVYVLAPDYNAVVVLATDY